MTVNELIAKLQEIVNDGHGDRIIQNAEAVGISVGQVGGACKTLVADGRVNKSEIKVDKSRKVGYSVASTD